VKLDPILRLALSASMMRIRMKSPFLAVLAAYLKLRQVPDDDKIQTAATDGLTLFINKVFWLAMKPEWQDFVLAHELLHAALGHAWRHAGREPRRWNRACDYVSNLILVDAKFTMPEGEFAGLLDEKYRKMSAEEVYLLVPPSECLEMVCDIIPGPPGGEAQKEADKQWAHAKSQAATVARQMGNTPSDELLQVAVEESTVSWKEILWREMSSGSADFKEWDRRFLHDELYVESIEDEEQFLECGVFVDTSGSTMSVLGQFLGEVKQIAELYKYTRVWFYWCDAALIGPIPLDELDQPQGGGGTSFVPAFEEAEERQFKRVVYLTDLEGTFPAKAPDDCHVIWCVPPGAKTEVPFGEIIRILDVEEAA
jgi:predicted metal-dependent peptidase